MYYWELNKKIYNTPLFIMSMGDSFDFNVLFFYAWFPYNVLPTKTCFVMKNSVYLMANFQDSWYLITVILFLDADN